MPDFKNVQLFDYQLDNVPKRFSTYEYTKVRQKFKDFNLLLQQFDHDEERIRLKDEAKTVLGRLDFEVKYKFSINEIKFSSRLN